MPLALIILVVVLIVMFIRFKTTDLTRNCRWRQDRVNHIWRCSYCGEVLSDTGKPPTICPRKSDQL